MLTGNVMKRMYKTPFMVGLKVMYTHVAFFCRMMVERKHFTCVLTCESYVNNTDVCTNLLLFFSFLKFHLINTLTFS